MNPQTQTAFFGGSFDPPHLGHLAVAKAALSAGLCGQVAWVPAFAPPHKRRSGASFADRARMVELTIAGQPRMAVSRIEEELHFEPSYTIRVLEAWQSRFGEAPALLIGADSLLELHSWHRARELVERWRIITYPRDGSEVNAAALAAHWGAAEVERLLAGVIPGDFFEISSSELKNRMEKITDTGDIIHMKEYLAEGVRAYIVRNGLYAGGGPRRA
ncbi:MAG: nicotinate (nicotinamide) nucleotide adenylyltransferase [Lentisphaeria bacterium]|nr:nicotinate (nicotinamide) nucleotide adenylyltransferase [Lentisphaeria bacterium]